MKMLTTKSIALHLATNRYDLSHYGVEVEALSSAEKDFQDYSLISLHNGFDQQSLLNENLTKPNLEQAIRRAAKSLKANDFFFLTFAGYGSTVPRYNPLSHEASLNAWCLFDGLILCKEIERLLAIFQAEVRIFVISDCSYNNNTTVFSSLKMDKMGVRSLPIELSEHIYLRNKDQYDGISLQIDDSLEILPSIIWLSSCQVNQMAHENNYNGLLTASIKRVWKGGNFKGNYSSFFHEICISMPPIQSPLVELHGIDAARFLKMRPFTN